MSSVLRRSRPGSLAFVLAPSLVCAAALVACRAGDGATPDESPARASATAAAADPGGVRVDGEPGPPRTVSVPGTGVSIAFVPLPGGELFGAPVEPFALAATEVTWDQFMAMVAETEGPPASEDGAKIDGLARPTKPYIAIDRGFGMEDRPVISISATAAESFCDWLTLRTGERFRLPTEREWEWAARAGSPRPFDRRTLDARAWYAANADERTHPVATREPNEWGLHDLFGNAAEWTVALAPREGRWGAHVLCGSSYREPAELCGYRVREWREASWNRSDPQIPKSVYWLADAPWPGMRVVLELE